MNNFEIFLKTAELGNITRAANMLNYTQSGVSQAISNLENELGFKLFIRGKKGVKLTDKGSLILPEIQNLVNQQNKVIQTANDINSVVKGKIRISAFPSVITELVTDLIIDFNKEYKDVKFEIIDEPYESICENLKNGTADIGFLPEAYAKRFSNHFLYEDEVLAMLPTTHELCMKDYVSINDLLEYPFVSQFKGCEKFIEEITEHIDPKYDFFDDRVAMKMIANGMGVGIITDSLLKYVKNITVCTRSFSPVIKRKIFIVTPEENDTNLIKIFRDFTTSYLIKNNTK